ncbi:MAG: hypothetical protein ACOY0T_06675 [Myxococcota bacterium]
MSLNALRVFLSERVESFEELEALLLLRGAGVPLTTFDLSERLGLSEASTSLALQALVTRGLLRSLESGAAARYWYSAENPFDSDVERLAATYRNERMLVVELMAKNALARIRSAALRTFAEAFRVRGRKDDS